MLLVYSYTKIQEVLTLFEAGSISSLVFQDTGTEEHPIYVMNYERTEEQPNKNELIAEMNKPSFFSTRIHVVKILNEFIKNESANNLIKFEFDFNLNRIFTAESVLKYSVSCKESLPDNEPIDWDNGLIASLRKIAIEKGCVNLETTVYEKTPGAGAKKKQEVLTVNQLIDKLAFILGI